MSDTPILKGLTPLLIRCETLVVITRVLPLPGPAITNTGPSVVSTANCCSEFKDVIKGLFIQIMFRNLQIKDWTW